MNNQVETSWTPAKATRFVEGKIYRTDGWSNSTSSIKVIRRTGKSVWLEMVAGRDDCIVRRSVKLDLGSEYVVAFKYRNTPVLLQSQNLIG
jgi:hypothetical protein